MGGGRNGSERAQGKQCKVLGCDAIIGEECSRYQQKKRVCAEHLRADAVYLKQGGDELYRFCQQCGKLERLERFQGTKRSCRMSLAKRRNSNSDNSGSSDATAAAHRHPALQNRGAYNDNSSASDTSTCYHKEMLPAPAPVAQPNAVDAAALLAEAWCSADSMFECEIDNFAGEDEESLMIMLENELLAAAAAATPAATTQQLPLQLSALSCMGGGSNDYCNSRINDAAAPAAMPVAAAAAAAAAVTATAMPANAAARLQVLQTQFAALQVELMALKNMHAELLIDVQQIDNNAASDATAAWASKDHAGYYF